MEAAGFPAVSPVQFSRRQRNLAIQAMDEAEEHTTRYYCIPRFRWDNLRYDLLTRRDREWEPLPDSALARIQRYDHVRPARNRTHDFYRIQLNDPSILLAARRENLERHLYPFLVYILTHEMVHLVRLSSILADEPATRQSQEAEEARVRGVAHCILNGSSDSRLRPVLSAFSEAGEKYQAGR
jgi:hypothetical protein